MILAVSLSPVTTASAAPPPPLSTTSYYMRTVNQQRHYDLGCALGDRTESLPGIQQDFVVLHYFQPVQFSPTSFGASLESGADATTTQIGDAAGAFARGYFVCSGLDTLSQLRLSVGTTNNGSQVTTAHGRAWALMVNQANVNIGAGVRLQAQIWGANDMELGFNSPAVTRAWVDGYDQTNIYRVVNYGDAAGCRDVGDGQPAGSECGTATFPQWTAEDVYYISWGSSPAYPLPQIYLNNVKNANQWKAVKLYGVAAHGNGMELLGALTQSLACADVGCDPALDNTPAQGWSQLWDALNSDPRTAQSLRYSTDIRWQGGQP